MQTQLFPHENIEMSGHPSHLNEVWLLSRNYKVRTEMTRVAHNTFLPLAHRSDICYRINVLLIRVRLSFATHQNQFHIPLLYRL